MMGNDTTTTNLPDFLTQYERNEIGQVPRNERRRWTRESEGEKEARLMRELDEKYPG